MFKLINIINSGVNVPEPVLLPADPSIVLDAGATAVFTDGQLTLGAEDVKPTHIIIRKKLENEKEALCYRITPDMLFEVEVYGDNVDTLLNGQSLCLHIDGNGYTKCSDLTIDGVALIHDENGAFKDNDSVIVSFP